MTCFACRCVGRSPETAFLAGISFAFQFNNEAIETRLCPAHVKALLRGHAGTLPTVRPEDRRPPPDRVGSKTSSTGSEESR